jgi:hypothetical protein
MELFDKLKHAAEEHGDKLDGAVDKVADVVDDRTGGKHTDKIDAAVEKAKDFLGEKGDNADPTSDPPSRLSP